MQKTPYFFCFMLLAICAQNLCAQESSSIFNFLNYPNSSHVTALGGKNVSLPDDDISFVFHNPALLSNVSNKSMGLNFSTFMKGGKSGSAAYSQMAGERGSWAAGVQFVGYGSMRETSPEAEILGDASALDMAISGSYAYLLGERWTGGATGKFIYSKLSEFTSVALAVDLGLNYYDSEKSFSLSAAARNIGVQVKRFADYRESLPFDLEVGFTKGLGHAPIRFSFTLIDLTHWRSSDYYTAGKETSAGRIFTNHFNLGIEVIPSDLFYVSAGYNFRRAYEMTAAGSSHAAGLSFGAGLNLKRFKVGMAYAKYHLGAPTLAFSLSYSLAQHKK